MCVGHYAYKQRVLHIYIYTHSTLHTFIKSIPLPIARLKNIFKNTGISSFLNDCSLLPVLSKQDRDRAPISERLEHNTCDTFGGRSHYHTDFAFSVSLPETSSPCARFEPTSPHY